MANSSTLDSGIRTLIQDNIGDEVTSVLFPRFVLLYLLMKKNGTKQGVYGLGSPMVDGRPNTGIYVAGKAVQGPRKEEIMGALEFKPTIQFQELVDYTSNITNLHDNDTAVEAWESNQMETTLVKPSYRWSVKQTPIEVSQMTLRMTKNSVAGKERKVSAVIGDLWLAHTNHALSQHCRGISNEMLGIDRAGNATSGAPSSITSDLWSQQYAISKIIGSTTNNYAGRDRALSANADWRPLVNSTAQSLNLRDMLTWARSTAPILASGGGTMGTGLNTFGLFIDVLIMGNDLWPSALAQADALKGQVFHSGGFPDYPEVGYNRQIIVLDGNVAVINEPSWPAGTVAGLSLDTWFMAIHPDANFTVSEPEKQNRLAGGHRSVAANIETQWMFGTIWPQGNTYWSSVSA